MSFKFKHEHYYFIKGRGDEKFTIVQYLNGTLYKFGGGDKHLPSLVTEAYEADITLGQPVEKEPEHIPNDFVSGMIDGPLLKEFDMILVEDGKVVHYPSPLHDLMNMGGFKGKTLEECAQMGADAAKRLMEAFPPEEKLKNN